MVRTNVAAQEEYSSPNLLFRNFQCLNKIAEINPKLYYSGFAPMFIRVLAVSCPLQELRVEQKLYGECNLFENPFYYILSGLAVLTYPLDTVSKRLMV